MTPSLETWTDHLRRTLLSYDEPLLRLVSNKLCKPRNHWPVEELIERCMGTLTNVAVLDRRLKDQSTASRLAWRSSRIAGKTFGPWAASSRRS